MSPVRPDMGTNASPGARGGKPTVPLLFVTLSLDVGGAERQLSTVLPELVRRGWPVTIYCMNRLGAFADAVAAAGVDVRGPPVAREPGAQSTHSRLYSAALAGYRLFGIIRTSKPRIVHFFLPEPYLIGAPVALLLGVPIRIMSRRGLNLYQRNWPGSRAVERWLHPRMAGVLANSRRVAAELLDEGCRPGQVGLIYNGVAIDGFGNAHDRAEVRQSLGLAPDALVAIVVANLVRYKGHADVLEALGAVRDRLPQPWTLLCIGRDEGMRASLEDLATARGLAGAVRFLGVRSDVARLLGAADLSILASHEEGFSNAVIEAMAAGLPQVVTDVGGNAEAVIDGEHGFVVPPQAPGPLGDAILRLALDASLRCRFGSAARQRAAQNFSIAACVDLYERVYRGLLAGARAGDVAPV